MANKVLYNVTVKIDAAIHEEWLTWMKESHIPDVMKTRCFLSYRITRIIEEPDDHGVGYAIQYLAENQQAVSNYLEHHAKKLQQEHAQRYNNRYAAFRTLLEVIGEGE
jgi:hypothetical protein